MECFISFFILGEMWETVTTADVNGWASVLFVVVYNHQMMTKKRVNGIKTDIFCPASEKWEKNSSREEECLPLTYPSSHPRRLFVSLPGHFALISIVAVHFGPGTQRKGVESFRAGPWFRRGHVPGPDHPGHTHVGVESTSWAGYFA